MESATVGTTQQAFAKCVASCFAAASRLDEDVLSANYEHVGMCVRFGLNAQLAMGLKGDYDALLDDSVLTYGDFDPPIDVSDTGPLGPIWPNGPSEESSPALPESEILLLQPNTLDMQRRFTERHRHCQERKRELVEQERNKEGILVHVLISAEFVEGHHEAKWSIDRIADCARRLRTHFDDHHKATNERVRLIWDYVDSQDWSFDSKYHANATPIPGFMLRSRNLTPSLKGAIVIAYNLMRDTLRSKKESVR